MKILLIMAMLFNVSCVLFKDSKPYNVLPQNADRPQNSSDTANANNAKATILELQKKLERQKNKALEWKRLSDEAQTEFAQIWPLLKSRCASCHDSDTPLPFYGKIFPDKNSVKHHRDDGLKSLDFAPKFPLRAQGDPPQIALLKAIQNSVIERRMPLKIYTAVQPWKKITKNDEEKILEWSDKLISRLEDFEKTYGDGEETSLEGKAVKILSMKCYRCHALGNDYGNFGDLEKFDVLMKGPFINLQNLEQSRFYKVMVDKEMPPSPRDALDSEELSLILEWLEQRSKEITP